MIIYDSVNPWGQRAIFFEKSTHFTNVLRQETPVGFAMWIAAAAAVGVVVLIVVEVGSASVAIVVSFAVSFVVSPVDSVAAVAGSARTWQGKSNHGLLYKTKWYDTFHKQMQHTRNRKSYNLRSSSQPVEI